MLKPVVVFSHNHTMIPLAIIDFKSKCDQTPLTGLERNIKATLDAAAEGRFRQMTTCASRIVSWTYIALITTKSVTVG